MLIQMAVCHAWCHTTAVVLDQADLIAVVIVIK